MRDAANGADFTAQVRERFGLDARTIDGAEEAALTFAGATSERQHDGAEVVVIDIGGGSTEFVAGRDGVVTFHVSTQSGVVRQTERHLHDDPPPTEGLQSLAAEVQAIIEGSVPAEVRERVQAAIAVAGTATQCAAIEMALDPYDPARVHGHALELGTCELLLARLAQMTDAQRREVVGLHPDRAPTIVAGIAMLIEAMRAFGLERVEVSEHDILRGAALALAASRLTALRRLSRRDCTASTDTGRTSYSRFCQRSTDTEVTGIGDPHSQGETETGHRSEQAVRSAPPAARATHRPFPETYPLPVLSGPTSGSRPFPWGRLPPLSAR